MKLSAAFFLLSVVANADVISMPVSIGNGDLSGIGTGWYSIAGFDSSLGRLNGIEIGISAREGAREQYTASAAYTPYTNAAVSMWLGTYLQPVIYGGAGVITGAGIPVSKSTASFNASGYASPGYTSTLTAAGTVRWAADISDKSTLDKFGGNWGIELFGGLTSDQYYGQGPGAIVLSRSPIFQLLWLTVDYDYTPYPTEQLFSRSFSPASLESEPLTSVPEPGYTLILLCLAGPVAILLRRNSVEAVER